MHAANLNTDDLICAIMMGREQRAMLFMFKNGPFKPFVLVRHVWHL